MIVALILAAVLLALEKMMWNVLIVTSLDLTPYRNLVNDSHTSP
jgi:hypothetical protein